MHEPSRKVTAMLHHRHLAEHDGYAEHSHEVRPDHKGVKHVITPDVFTPNELLNLARAATYNDSYKEAADYWLILDELASAGRLPREWEHYPTA